MVAIKPNISWARGRQFAATAHPQVMEAVIELCKEAGARKVRIVENTIHDARRCFILNGAGHVAKKTGAEFVAPRSCIFRKMKLRGNRLDVWPVMVPLVEADKLISIPVAKDHSLTEATLGMKNWIRGVRGSRWALYQDIHQSIVDFARFFNHTVTLIDAITVQERKCMRTIFNMSHLKGLEVLNLGYIQMGTKSQTHDSLNQSIYLIPKK